MIQNIACCLFFTPVLIRVFASEIGQTASRGRDMHHRLVPLSAEQADAMIHQEATAKAEEQARRRARLLDPSTFRIIEQIESSIGQQKLTFNRVAAHLPESFEPQPEFTELIQLQEPLAEDNVPQMCSEYPQKEHRTLMLSATVYDLEFTRLQWDHQGQHYVTWSHIDFNYLRGLTEIETEDASYLFFLCIGNESSKKIRERTQLAQEQGLPINRANLIPTLPNLKENELRYVVVTPGRSEKKKKGCAYSC